MGKLVESQLFLPSRLKALGPDLSAAHFLCWRGCRVRFKGHTHWTSVEKGTLDIPATYVPGWHIEAIDASSSKLVYEGLQNLKNLHYLKELDLSYSEFIDEWCVDRITGEYHNTLEDLTIICLMLLDVLPKLKIEGADYLDMSLLEGTEHEHLLLEVDGSPPKLEAGDITDISNSQSVVNVETLSRSEGQRNLSVNV